MSISIAKDSPGEWISVYLSGDCPYLACRYEETEFEAIYHEVYYHYGYDCWYVSRERAPLGVDSPKWEGTSYPANRELLRTVFPRHSFI